MMRANQRLARELVQRAREPFGETAAVHENERGVMRMNQIEESRINRRPNRDVRDVRNVQIVRNVLCGRTTRAAWLPGTIRTIRPRHIFNGHLNTKLERLAIGGVDNGYLSIGRSLVAGRTFLVELGLDFFDGGN